MDWGTLKGVALSYLGRWEDDGWNHPQYLTYFKSYPNNLITRNLIHFYITV